MEVFATAHDALFTQVWSCVRGERLLVNGAAGSVGGTAAVQLALAGGRAEVTNRAARESRELVRRLGAGTEPDRR